MKKMHLRSTPLSYNNRMMTSPGSSINSARLTRLLGLNLTEEAKSMVSEARMTMNSIEASIDLKKSDQDLLREDHPPAGDTEQRTFDIGTSL
jgi:hypothetical protein